MTQNKILLEPNTLWDKTLKATQQALDCGALLPIETVQEFIPDQGVNFLARMVSSLKHKKQEKKQKRLDEAKSALNPFLPYDPAMFVADVSDTHVCLLNKFNVIERHLLIVTRRFEDQEQLLTVHDFHAWWACLLEGKSLGFYNAGIEGGASQPHKHLQMIPLPMADSGPEVPIEPILNYTDVLGIVGSATMLPFIHALSGLGFADEADMPAVAETLYKLYRQMLETVNLNPLSDPETSKQAGPYNLLLTRQWMLLVPRFCEFFSESSINALGFAGALLAINQEQMQLFKSHGPMNVLKQVAIPYPSQSL